MRILDVGCHDAFITSYVGRKVPGLHVDGIEANVEAVERATRRMAADGIPGSFVVGLAEDAAVYFDVQSYDAVVAFELIEHILDVDRFLDALEMMVRPGGRVYLSTPDGTFGEGNNPHHLRAYRAVDLADLLRRRGELTDMQVGPDGICVASYVPGRPRGNAGEVAIYCGPGWKQWSPLDADTPGVGLGGSETAARMLGEELNRLGYAVTVYGEVQPGCYGQVIYRHHTVFDPMEDRTAVISSRMPHIFDRPVRAGARILWMHDTDCGPELTEARAERIDSVMVLSRWHLAHVRELYPFVDTPGKLHATGNGIRLDLFDGEPPQRNRRRAIYSSSPDRGLDFLLRLWPKVRERVPDAELAYCYADVYDEMAKKRPDLAAFRAELNKLSEQPGVVKLGSLSQRELASEMRSSGLWLAPSWCSPAGVQFNETFCIGAVEAAAAGCSIVASRWGALPERMETADDYMLLDSPEAGGPPDEGRWVSAIVAMLSTPDGVLHFEPGSYARQVTWAGVARDFADVIG